MHLGQRLDFYEEVEMARARAKGRKVRADEAVGLLEQWERSGEPMSSWCAARGLSWYSLSAHKGWLATRRDSEPCGEVAFAEVVLEESLQTVVPTGGRYRVKLGDVVVEVDEHFQDTTLRRLLRVVASC